ncbi:MAG: hypothetical protein N2508_01230 [Anaerolineae bacterium]|nr:hypothetical protein [Anaerolineae bacterium]
MRSRDAKLLTFAPPVYLLLLALFLLRPVVAHPTWWLWSPGAEHSDLAVTHWPNAHFTRRSLWEESRFPIWRPTIMSGTPFAANPLAGLYYLPNWLFLFLPYLPLETGFNLSALCHLWLAGATMYALMRRGFESGTWGALAAASAYQASPKLLAHLGAGHVGWTQAWAWLPLVILCVLRLGETTQRRIWPIGREARWLVVGSAALALQFCADVRLCLYTLIAAVTLIVVCSLRWRRFPLAFATMGVVAAGLSACQWLPMMAMLPETTRASLGLEDAAVWSLPWRYLVGLLLADHNGFHEWMTYAGISTLILAIAGAGTLWRAEGRRWQAMWLVGLAAGAAWFSLGEHGGLFGALWRIVPGLGLLRVPPRAWVLVVFALSVLAGSAFEGPVRRRGRRLLRPLELGLVVLAPLLAAGFWLARGMLPLNLLMFGLVTPLTLVICRLRAEGRPNVTNAALILLIVADLAVVDGTLIESRAPAEVFAAGRAAAEWLAARPGRFRIYSPGYSIPQHVAELYGLELADGVDPFQLRVYAEYLTRAAGLGVSGEVGYSVTLPPLPEGTEDISTALADVTPNPELLGQLGVRYVVSAFPITHPALSEHHQVGGLYVYLNSLAQPVQPAENSIVLGDGTALFTYDPLPVYIGWGCSALTILALSVMAVVNLRRGPHVRN